MKYARRGVRWLTLFGASNPWTGATWALDGSGRAYNTPTLGSELLTNGGFDSDTVWVKGAGWTISTGVASHTSTNAYITHTYAPTAGIWYRFAYDIVARTSGSVLSEMAGVNGPSRSSVASWVDVIRANTSAVVRLYASSFVGSIDNVTVKQVTLPTTIATVAGASAAQTAAAKIHTLTTGTQAGVGALIDSTSNPQNFLIAYHDGTNVKLDKCVAGTYTSLISTAVAFSSNAQIEIRRPSGNTFQLWYGGTQRGTDQTVSDAGIISNTRYGLFSTYSGNTASEFSLGGASIPFSLPGA